MGNYQFGLNNKPPDFIGKGWMFLKEKKKSNNERKYLNSQTSTSTAPSSIQRPANLANFSKFRDEESDLDTPGSCSSQFGGTPKPAKRPQNVKRSKSMRCSPTVPNSVTLTFGMVNNAVIGSGGVAAAATGAASSDAMTSALDALHRLTPAAPPMFKEPSFDDFFEEAERRNRTMQVLQAALGGRSASTATIGGLQRASPNQPTHLERASSFNVVEKEKSSCPRNNAMSRPSPPPIRKISNTSVGRLSINVIGPEGEAQTDETTAPRFNRDHCGGRLLIIVGGCNDGKSKDSERWDRPPPTIIVQPERTDEALFSPEPSCASSGSPRSERHHPFANPTCPQTPCNSTSLGVRFADELDSDSTSASAVETPIQGVLKDPRRVKRRSSLRRKTIGVITSLSSSPEEKSAKMEIRPCNRPLKDTGSTVSSLSLTPNAMKRYQSQNVISKKSSSKSDIITSPPIIRLLTPAQIILIRGLWYQIYTSKGPTVLGNHIFQRVVFKNAQIRDVFRNVDVGNRGYNVDVMCKGHAMAIASVMDEVVKNLDNLDRVELRLIEVGKKHAIFHDLGFHTRFWSAFGEAFIDCTLEWGEKNRRVEEARKAWAIIIAYVTDKLKLGYQEERRTMPRSPTGRRIRVVSETEIRIPDDLMPKLNLTRSDSH